MYVIRGNLYHNYHITYSFVHKYLKNTTLESWKICKIKQLIIISVLLNLMINRYHNYFLEINKLKLFSK